MSMSSPDNATRRARRDTSVMSEMNFVVVGAQGVGKTTFVRCALDLKKQPDSPASSKKMSLEGNLFLVKLLEMQLTDVIVKDDQTVSWPASVENEKVLRVDGVLVLYDVTNRDSMSRVPDLLNACLENETPCVLVSCKCDTPLSSRCIDPKQVEQSCMERTGFASVQTAVSIPETHKRCISHMLKIAAPESGARKKLMSMRPRASTAGNFSRPSSSQTTGARGKHGRAASETPHKQLERSQTLDSLTRQPDHSTISDKQAGSNAFQPVDEASADEPDLKDTDVDTLAPASLSEKSFASSDRELGLTLEELVDRMLGQPMSMSDTRFVTVFLCLYRDFATPAQLLSAILRRFEGLRENDDAQLIRISSQLRHLGILAQWLAEYPGDFAYPITHRLLASFINNVASNRVFALAASEMSVVLNAVTEDDDTDWACSDSAMGPSNTMNCFSGISYAQPDTADLVTTLRPEDPGGPLALPSRVDGKMERSAKHEKRPSTASSVDHSGSSLRGSSSILISSSEAGRSQADILGYTPRNPLSKAEWRQFMDTSDGEIAQQLTRIDWIMLVTIRPRDLIRHVSLTEEQREQCKNLEHVSRMADHFNHVAFWVTNMILFRDKAKHRAMAMEKFLSIAWKLRQLNNYNALGAVMAGLNSIAIHRLTQTREFVTIQAQKDFMRLNILMGTQKSHFAYRLAYENTTSEKIPFIPLHRRDLVSAQEGNRTFLDEASGRINWAKFEILGEVIDVIQKAQSAPYPHLSRNIDIERLILDIKLTKDEDVLFERSLHVEGAGAGETFRKRFNWLQRY